MAEAASIDPARQQELATIIRRLHDGEAVDLVRRDFAALIEGVSAAEIAAMEQSLIDGGMPVEEVLRLCDVHVEVFRSELKKGGKAHSLPGHPVHSYLEENREARPRIARLRREARSLAWGLGDPEAAKKALDELSRIKVHFERKENQLFPWLERHGFTGPSKVMWGKHDEIRAQFKTVAQALELLMEGPASKGPKRDRVASKSLAKDFNAEVRKLAGRLKRMVFMEERILIPNAIARLDDKEWAEIRRGEDAIGFAWIEPGAVWDVAFAGNGVAFAENSVAGGGGKVAPSLSDLVAGAQPGRYDRPAAAEGSAAAEGAGTGLPVQLRVGALSAEIIDLVFRNLPVDLSFVDADDKVAWYSDGPHRIFPRSPGAIGRDVRNCHPPKSLAVVERILDSFRKGTKDSARFWIEMGGKFIVIEYIAIRDAAGRYLGTLEASQDATGLRALEGQRRLPDWEEA
ncbi:MAG TPA: DUF438 domain-containing protein [Rectinemataceae bacterium]|nr:DUF438 domain-containing protein [Rectinemataceae bacterium]